LINVPIGYFIPPPDRPRWDGRSEISRDLLLLGWGRRFHGRNPAPRFRHAGWLYILLTSGSPIYLINEFEVKAEPFKIIVIHPECSFGVRDRPAGCCQWLLWMWAEPPRHGLRIPFGAYSIFSLPERDIAHFREIHNRCRLEVARPDQMTSSSLNLHHEMLDIALARSAQSKRPEPPENFLRDMAVRWLESNISTREPVALLCEYLQISASTLNRLFRKELHESPGNYHQILRMEFARRELSEGKSSVKEIGYHLGYAHPGDFSRAYRKFCSCLPTQERERLFLTKRKAEKINP